MGGVKTMMDGALRLAATIGDLFAPWWEKKQRLETSQAELQALKARHELEAARDNEQADAARRRAAETWYPLGMPGRLRDLPTFVNPLIPRVLIGPISAGGRWDGVTQRTEAALLDFDSSAEMLGVIRGAFVPGPPALRPMSQTVAAEIARYEFDPSPSLIVFEETQGSQIVVTARLNSIATTTAGDAAFDIPLVRYSEAGTSVCSWEASEDDDGVSQAWQPLSAAGLPGSEAEAIAEVLASSVVVIAAMYWDTRGVRWQDTRPDQDGLASLLDLADPAGARRRRAGAERLLTEVTALENQYGQVSLTELDDSDLAIIVDQLPDLTLIVSPDYPAEPPCLLITSGAGVVSEISIAAGAWSPARSLLEICQGVGESASHHHI